jgi:hypothetical protein
MTIASTQLLTGELVSFYIHEASAACGGSIEDLPFSSSAIAPLIVRGQEVLAPSARTDGSAESRGAGGTVVLPSTVLPKRARLTMLYRLCATR